MLASVIVRMDIDFMLRNYYTKIKHFFVVLLLIEVYSCPNSFDAVVHPSV